MKWEDIEGSAEYAEALTLLASLIAAVLALKKAEKDESDDLANEQTDGVKAPEIPVPLKARDLPSLPIDNHAPESKMPTVVIGLCVVAVIQLAIILFIAYRLLW